MQEYTIVGKRLPLLDAVEKTMGRAVFTVDMELPGMLHARILRSPHAHARVLHVDTSRAERLAGVKVVLSKNNRTANEGTCNAWRAERKSCF